MSKLQDQVNGRTSLAIIVPLKFLGRLFDVVGMCLVMLDGKLGEEVVAR
jgi:hypothetical protein